MLACLGNILSNNAGTAGTRPKALTKRCLHETGHYDDFFYVYWLILAAVGQELLNLTNISVNIQIKKNLRYGMVFKIPCFGLFQSCFRVDK